jgi:hypothetical protein
MSRLFFVALLVLPALVACCCERETNIAAYTSDAAAAASLERSCADLADTGDMYRYCMRFGPQQALAAEH